MTTILNINTAFETASVNLSVDEEILVEAENNSQKDHASFLEPAVRKICRATEVNLNSIDAISVINGPGSYTGLRVGLSSAKALCYALKKPLILLNTLDVMAMALKLQSPVQQENVLFCPLIDARRQEVYTGLYDYNLKLIKYYSAEILDNNFLLKEKKDEIIIAGGSGSLKLREISNNKNILYINSIKLSKPAVILANRAVILKKNSDIVYCEPFYLKPVYFRNANL